MIAYISMYICLYGRVFVFFCVCTVSVQNCLFGTGINVCLGCVCVSA